MLRKTLISLAVSGALFASSSYALELGELTSQSNLDEPYRGKIELSDAGVLTTDDILVRIGSESEFRQAGFPPTRVLSQLTFDVIRENGDLIVAVSSDEPLEVDELHFILAARWPSGQVVREYQTPINQSALVEKAQEEVVQVAPVVANAVPEADLAPARVSSAVPLDANGEGLDKATAAVNSAGSENQINVARGNTLWSIADRNRTGNQLTIYQTMMAIQALNKNAFYSDNINLLKEGAILRLPTEDQVALFNQSTSVEEFKRQHDAWMALKGNQSNAAVEQAQLNTQAESKAASNETESASDKLTLSSGQSLLPEGSASSNTGDNNSAALQALQAELSASQEMLDKERREKTEMSEQLGELNEQLETLETLIGLKDKQMAELMQQFANAQQALQEQKNTVDQLLEADQIRREKELAEENSLMNQIFGNPIVVSMGAVVLLLLGFLIGLVMRRSGKKGEELSSKKDEFDLSPTMSAVPVAASADEEIDDDDDFLSLRSESAVSEPKPEFKEEDPFAFDFDSESEDDIDDDFDSFDEDIAAFDEPIAEEETDFSEDPEAELESAYEDDGQVETDDEVFASFDQTDDMPDPVVEIEDEEFDEADVPTVAPENVEEDIAEVDVVEEVEPEAQLEEALEEEVEPEASEMDIPEEAETIDDQIDSDEESFVANLLEDTEQEDVDESAIFNNVPNDALESTIEETLAEAQDNEEELDIPSFGEAEAAGDEEESDEEEEFDFFDASGDEMATKLDLARAYMDMGDEEGARIILEDVLEAGNEEQISEAQKMMERMFPGE